MRRFLACVATCGSLLSACGHPPCDCLPDQVCDDNTGTCSYVGYDAGAGGGTGGGGGGSGGGTATGGGGGSTGGGSGWSGCGNPPDAGACSDTWNSYAGGWFSGHCSSCHGSAWNDYATVHSDSSLLTSLVTCGTMPPGGASQADRARIGAWFLCGSPQ